ncbi:hypothetical protein J6590_028941 [Homalodisca vitripennis]|nr:hypothetical protein J6590_028941 [Homalodisca vitripennis]
MDGRALVSERKPSITRAREQRSEGGISNHKSGDNVQVTSRFINHLYPWQMRAAYKCVLGATICNWLSLRERSHVWCQNTTAMSSRPASYESVLMCGAKIQQQCLLDLLATRAFSCVVPKYNSKSSRPASYESVLMCGAKIQQQCLLDLLATRAFSCVVPKYNSNVFSTC